MAMKVREAIDRTDSLKHNTYTESEKVEWLSRLDGMVKQQIIDTHEDGEDIIFDGYTQKDSMDTVLLVPMPFDEVYIRWLEAQIDYYNGEIDRYNNSIAMFQSAYDAYSRHYNRLHLPKTEKLKFW
jgi:hypothetical protein